MISVSKDYQIKTKMIQEEWLQLKMPFLFFYWVELTFARRVYIYIKELYQQGFLYNEEMKKLRVHHIHKSAKVAILLLQDLSTLCVTDIYGIYFHLCVQCS